MPLRTLDDILAAAKNTPGKTVAQVMKTRINDLNNPMPPKGQTPLKDAEFAALNAWLDAQTPPGGSTCTNLPPPGDLNALTGPAYLPCDATKGETRRDLKANQSGGKYPVPSSNNTADYHCFTFPAFPSGQHVHGWAPIIDESRVLHHWLLFGTTNGSTATTGVGCQLAVTNTLIAGWAPGGSNAVLPENPGGISLNLDPSAYPFYVMQIHYVNTTGSTLPDASGVEFCTGGSRDNIAGMMTLGSNGISIPAHGTGTATGVCNSTTNGSDAISTDGSSIYVVSTSPHMHLTGTKFVTQHANHPDLSNIQDWNFDVQVHYNQNPVREVRPGEKLTTTCTYFNPTGSTIGFGPATTQEMCYDFAMVYPYGKLKNKKCPPGLL